LTFFVNRFRSLAAVRLESRCERTSWGEQVAEEMRTQAITILIRQRNSQTSSKFNFIGRLFFPHLSVVKSVQSFYRYANR
jgi:hypothetical protein